MVQGGDVLLTHGTSAISWAIRFFDRSEVNHAAIALDATNVGEAVAAGLKASPLTALISANEYVLHRRSRLGDHAPVVSVANDYLTNRAPYAYQQIVLLAVLGATRAIPLPRVAKRLIRSSADAAADVLNTMLDDGGTRLMICSEYVYRAFAEATPPHLLIADTADLAAASTGTEETWSFADHWAPRHEPELIAAASNDEAIPAAAGRSSVDHGDVERLAAEYALEVAYLDEEAAKVAVAAADSAVVSATPAAEPSDAELARSLVRLSGALEDAVDADGAQPAGLGVDLAMGALKGLLDTRVNPNFVTPGDLLRCSLLDPVGTLRR